MAPPLQKARAVIASAVKNKTSGRGVTVDIDALPELYSEFKKGSGVPEIQAYSNGKHIKGTLVRGLPSAANFDLFVKSLPKPPLTSRPPETDLEGSVADQGDKDESKASESGASKPRPA